MNELLDRLKALGLNIDIAANLKKRDKNISSLQAITNGKWIDFHEGRLFMVEENLPYGYSHGSVVLKYLIDLQSILFFHDKSIPSDIKINEIAFIDVETSGLSSGSGTLVFLVGICYLDDTGIRLVQVFLDDPINERNYLECLDDLLSKFQLLISYNGKTFDIPIMKTRYIMNRMHHQFDTKAHLDLLILARKIWKYSLESKSLSVIENEILNFHRSESEVPGWLVPQIYYDYLQNGDSNLLTGVFYHNKMDILSLSALFQFIVSLVSNEKNILDNEGLDIFSLACLLIPYLDNNKLINYFEKCIEKGLPDEKQIQIFNKIGSFYKINHLWEKAIAIWENNAKFGDCLSCVELAKYYEHRKKNYIKALYWANQAETILEKNGLSSNNLKIGLRKNRLLEKVSKSDE